MNISDAGLAMIKGFEGFREHAYQDIVGVWTVGFGETSLDGRPVHQGDVLPLAAATERLRARCDGMFGDAVRAATTPMVLAQHQYDACVSLAYNIGVGHPLAKGSPLTGFQGSTVARCIRAGQFETAGAAFLLWNKAGGKVAPVLVKRRAAERACFDHGIYPHV